MLIYLICVKPFTENFNNYMNVYCEIIVAVTFLVLFLINLFPVPELVGTSISWILISAIIIALGAIWIEVLPKTLKELFCSIRDRLIKDKSEMLKEKEEGKKASKEKKGKKRIRTKQSHKVPL